MICIDESGNLGRKGRYFIIAVLESSNKKRIKNIARRFLAKNGFDEIKGTLLTFTQREKILNSLNNADDYKVSYLVLDKNNLRRKELLGSNILFSYLCSYVLKKTIIQNNDEKKICFDNRTVRTESKHSLPDYLKLKALEWETDNKVDVEFFESESHYGIQIADVIANTIYRKYKKNKNHFYNQINIENSVKFPYKTFGN